MLNKELFINVSVANVYKEATFYSEVVTQALLGERVKVIKDQDGWYFIQQWDGYEGWINHFFTTVTKFKFVEKIDRNGGFTIRDLFSEVRQEPDISSPIFRDLVYGNTLALLDCQNNGWSEVMLPDGERGWTSAKAHQEVIENLRSYLGKESKRFLGIQYLWGGKSPKGFDCSGFVQTIMKSGGISLPRDSVTQEAHQKLIDISIGQIRQGDLIFFNNDTGEIDHVAISLGNSKFIHCSGFVKIESFDHSDDHYNERLSQKIVSVKSIKRWCH